MQTRHRNTFTTIHSEGALLPPDLLARISERDASLEGIKPSDYHLLKNEKLNEAINRSWNRLIGAWENFKETRQKLLVGQPGTTETRERWLLPLFQELGYGRLQTSAAFEIEGKSYPISHLWGSAPIHLLGCNIELDKRTPGIAGAARRSPHSMVQEFLNRSEYNLWAILSNGLRLRLLRDNVSLTRQSFLEFDLEAMMEGELYADFVLLWMLCHQSRFEASGELRMASGERRMASGERRMASGERRMENGELRMASGEKQLATRHSPITECWLEKWSHLAHEQGTRALDQLRNGVEQAINQLGAGFLERPSNQTLRAKLRDGSLSTQDYYRQLLRFVYRLIFLFVAEDRDLLFNPDSDPIAQQRYMDYYSTQRLRRLAERSRGQRHGDLWQGLLVVINLLIGKDVANGEWGVANGEWGRANGAPLAESHSLLALPILGGFLFSREATPDLDSAQLDNQHLLTTIRALAYTIDQRTLRPVDYKNLGPEELGSVYESLLELHPEMNVDAGTFNLTTAGGHERKTTGSYYTPSSLIQVLLDSALDPVVEDRLEMAKRMGNGEWRMVNGEWDLVEWKWKDEGEKDYANSILPRFRDLAAQHGFGGRSISPNQALPNNRTVRDDIANEAGSGFDTSQYRRGMGQERDEGISTFPKHRAGQSSGIRDTSTAESEGGIMPDGSDQRSVGDNYDPGKTDRISKTQSGEEGWLANGGGRMANGEAVSGERRMANGPLATHHSPSATRHQLLAESALVSLTVCDPACGSGHFLIAAAHRIARRLAGVRTGDDEPAPDATRAALRDVISRCIYGVDLNPMAVELCKVGLWMESLEPGKPLSFLDAHIKFGNSLVGVGPGVANGELRMENGVERMGKEPLATHHSPLTIPDDAFKPAFGDDKETASALRRRNKREREGQMGFRWDVTLIKDNEDLARWVANKTQQIETMPELDAQQIKSKEEAYQSLLDTRQFQQQRLEYDLWTAAFFWEIPKGDAEEMLAPTQQEMIRLQRGKQLDAELVRRVQEIAGKQRFFHWDLEYPQVFGGVENGGGRMANGEEVSGERRMANGEEVSGELRMANGEEVSGELRMANGPLATHQQPLATHGFDIVLGNPPWERIKLQEQEFFAGLEPEIAQAPNKAAREKLIKKLPSENPSLWELFCKEKRGAENTSNFVRNSARFPLTAIGDVNTYALFAGLVRHIINYFGRAGIIVPTGIATDDTTKQYFADVVESKSLVTLFDFENKEAIFQGVHRSYKFCLLTLSGSPVEKAEFIFFAQNINHLRDPIRRFSLSASEIKMFNPNTRTMPIFRTKPDAELTKYIYQRVPVLDNEITGENPWGVKFKTMFHMANDSHLFIDEPRQGYVPLYEAKLMHQFDHRWATYENGEVREVTLSEKQDPNYEVQPRYWVSEVEVEERLREWNKGWLMAFRNITNVTNERSTIFSYLPRIGVGHSAPLLFIYKEFLEFSKCLIGNLNSIILDYFVRQKLGGTNMTFGYIRQFPVLSPDSFSNYSKLFLDSRVLELACTSFDVKGISLEFSKKCSSYIWDENRRIFIRSEIDAYYAYLYGFNRKQLRYILDPDDLTEAELEDILDPWEEVEDALDQKAYESRTSASTFPGETFRVLKEKEVRKYGEYRTRRLVLEAWQRLAAVDFDVEAYTPMVDPPPAHPSMAHPNKDGSVYEGEVSSEWGVGSGEEVNSELRMASGEEGNGEGRVGNGEEVNGELRVAIGEDDVAAETDYGLYKCQVCGQMVMGFGKDEHVRDFHKGKSVEWKKLQ